MPSRMLLVLHIRRCGVCSSVKGKSFAATESHRGRLAGAGCHVMALAEGHPCARHNLTIAKSVLAFHLGRAGSFVAAMPAATIASVGSRMRRRFAVVAAESRCRAEPQQGSQYAYDWCFGGVWL